MRAMILLRARTLALGFSGARPLVAQAMVDALNAGVTPVVPEHGSLGASGDLAPLAHAALVLLGEGEAMLDGDRLAGGEALRRAGLRPIQLAEKEGLAVTNGTDAILGMLCLAIEDAATLLRQADIAAAMTVEGLLATDAPFAADLHRCARTLDRRRARRTCGRCSPRRRSWPAIAPTTHVCKTRIRSAARRRSTGGARHAGPRPCRCRGELAAAIDNPMVLPDGRVESCGNFHGAPLGFAADFLAIALAEVGAIAERRMDRVLDRTRSHGLPAFLADEVGVDSGLMIGHCTAAAMASENKRLAVPASTDSLPTSGMQEDHVSMAWGAVRSCAGSSTTSAGSSPSRSSSPLAPSTCAPRCSRPRQPLRSSPRSAPPTARSGSVPPPSSQPPRRSCARTRPPSPRLPPEPNCVTVDTSTRAPRQVRQWTR